MFNISVLDNKKGADRGEVVFSPEIDLKVYLLAQNVIHVRDNRTDSSDIAEISGLDRRIGLAEIAVPLDSLRIDMIYPGHSRWPMLVGFLQVRDRIVFELPLGDSQEALEKATQRGFSITNYSQDNNLVNGDIVDRHYFQREYRPINEGSRYSYQKTIGGRYEVSVMADYAEGVWVNFN